MAHQTQTDPIKIQPRDAHFAFQDAPRRDWLNGDPVRTLAFNALSITFPAGERFFIRSVMNMRKQITDPKLLADIKLFVAQEGAHTREHIAYNDQLEQQGYRAGLLHRITEARLDFAERKLSAKAKLAVTCALEHYTAVLAQELLSNPDLLEGADEAYRNVWGWHAIEEIEHKGVAFDVFQQAMSGKAYWLRVRSMMIVALLFLTNMARAHYVLMNDVGLGRSVRAWGRLTWFLWGKPGLFRKMIWHTFAYMRPGFHPWDDDNRDLIQKAEKSLQTDGSLHAAA